MAKLLLIVHVEESFRGYFDDTYIERLVETCNDEGTTVVHLTSCILDFEPIHELEYLIDKEIEFRYGYHPNYFEDEEEDQWIIPSNGHEYTWVPNEFRTNYLEGWSEIMLAGGSDSSCLQDMQEVLNFLEVDYERRVDIIY